MKQNFFRKAYYKVFALLLITLSILSQTQAASQFDTSKFKVPIANKQKKSKMTGNVSLSYSEPLVRQDEASQFKKAAILAGFSYELNSSWATSLKSGYQKDLRNDDELSEEVSDLGVSLKYLGLPSLSFAKQSIDTAVTIPFSKQSREREELNGALGFRYTWNGTPKTKGFSWNIFLGASKLFHKYETDKGGNVLTSHSIKEGLGLGYSFGRYSVGMEGSHSHRISYQNSTTQILSHSESIEVDIMPAKWSMALGHTNEGPWFKQASEDLNLEAINDDSSIIYLESKVSF